MIFQEMKLGTSVIPHFHVILPGPSISQGSSGDGEALKDGRQRSTQNFVGANYSNFTISFPRICRCAVDFFKVLLKF